MSSQQPNLALNALMFFLTAYHVHIPLKQKEQFVINASKDT